MDGLSCRVMSFQPISPPKKIAIGGVVPHLIEISIGLCLISNIGLSLRCPSLHQRHDGHIVKRTACQRRPTIETTGKLRKFGLASQLSFMGVPQNGCEK